MTAEEAAGYLGIAAGAGAVVYLIGALILRAVKGGD